MSMYPSSKTIVILDLGITLIQCDLFVVNSICKESHFQIRSQFSSVAQSCPTLCDPMNCSRPGLPAHHQLPEFTQTHLHRVSDAIQSTPPLSSPSPPAPNPSQNQSLFQCVNSLPPHGLQFARPPCPSLSPRVCSNLCLLSQ